MVPETMMIVLMFAALLGAALTAALSWQVDILTAALLLPLGRSFFALGAATLLYVVRSRESLSRNSGESQIGLASRAA